LLLTLRRVVIFRMFSGGAKGIRHCIPQEVSMMRALRLAPVAALGMAATKKVVLLKEILAIVPDLMSITRKPDAATAPGVLAIIFDMMMGWWNRQLLRPPTYTARSIYNKINVGILRRRLLARWLTETSLQALPLR
jgi:hypothetical protein